MSRVQQVNRSSNAQTSSGPRHSRARYRLHPSLRDSQQSVYRRNSPRLGWRANQEAPRFPRRQIEKFPSSSWQQGSILQRICFLWVCHPWGRPNGDADYQRYASPRPDSRNAGRNQNPKRPPHRHLRKPEHRGIHLHNGLLGTANWFLQQKHIRIKHFWTSECLQFLH